VDNFDPGYGSDFVGYAVPTVLGELKRHFRDQTWAIRVPRRLQELRLAIAAANNELTQTLCRAPTTADIAAHLELTEEEVLEGLEGARAYRTISLSTPAGPDKAHELSNLLGADDPEYALAEARMALGPAMAALDDRERTILTLRFYGNLAQTEIARRIGISQMHVSRLIARALLKLRHELNGADG
jgi:RNA polymerase sigma-B factor